MGETWSVDRPDSWFPGDGGHRNIANLQGFPQGCDVLLAPFGSNALCAVARLHGALPITHDVWGKKAMRLALGVHSRMSAVAPSRADPVVAPLRFPVG